MVDISEEITDDAEERGAAARDFFLSNPKRRYRAQTDSAGNVWIARRGKYQAIFRTCTTLTKTKPPPDRDDALREAWVRSAWRQFSSSEQSEIVRQIKRDEQE